MPTYSYRCTECETAFDIQQAFTEDSLTVCPTCGGVLRKVFSAVGLSVRRSGFDRHDSRASTSTSESSTPKTPAAAPAAPAAPAASTPTTT